MYVGNKYVYGLPTGCPRNTFWLARANLPLKN